MSYLFNCCRSAPYQVVYRDRALKDAREDLALFRNYSDDELDVDINAQGKISLVRLTRFQRFVNWVFFRNSYRLARLAAYTQRACGVDPGLDPVKTVQYYKNIRRFVPQAGTIDRKVQEAFTRSGQIYERVQEELQDAQDMQEEDLVRSKKSELAYRHWERIYTETHLAEMRGNAFIPAGAGVNGALFGHGLDGRRTMVRKDHGKDPRFVNEGTTLILRSQEEVCKNDPRQAETVAYEASDFFGFDVVPPTDTDEKGHSYQIFEAGGQSADNAGIKNREHFSPDELEQLQIMAIFDYLIGDLDGHDNNWNVHFKGDSTTIDRVVKFDNGNSFPEKSLGIRDALTLPKTFAWKNHRWAQKKLIPAPGSRLEKILKELFDPQEQSRFWTKIADKYPVFISTERISLMTERIAIIHAVRERKMSIAQLGEIYSIEALGRMRTLNGALLGASFDNYFSGAALHDVLSPADEGVARMGPILEEGEEEVAAALRNPRPESSLGKAKAVLGEWTSWAATTSADWLWGGVRKLASQFVPIVSPS